MCVFQQKNPDISWKFMVKSLLKWFHQNFVSLVYRYPQLIYGLGIWPAKQIKNPFPLIVGLEQSSQCRQQSKLRCLSWSSSVQIMACVLIGTQTLSEPVMTCHMMMSSNGNIFRVTCPLCGEFTGPGEFPTQRPVTRSVDVFFDLRLNKRLSKQPWGWWFETPSWSLWRQCND